jgi:glyoxylase-like metal-dependent hydrolase (beta-lactamase superfamily II)
VAGFYSHSEDSSYAVYPIRGLLGYFHLLHDVTRREAVLIDAGLVDEMPRLAATLKKIELDWRDIKAILLSHGHMDHTGHIARIKQLSGALLLAHPAEQAHIDGTFPYRGPSRVCGALEKFGRWLLHYQPAQIDEPLHAEMELPYWGGLRVIHLPGHTLGHCGFYSARFRLLFAGDLYASYGFSTHLPPAIFNSCPECLDASLARVTELSPKLIIPNHYFGFDGELHRRRFEALVARKKSLHTAVPHHPL